MCTAKNTRRMYLKAVSDFEKRKPKTFTKVMNGKLNKIKEKRRESQCSLKTSTSRTTPMMTNNIEGIIPIQKSALMIPNT